MQKISKTKPYSVLLFLDDYSVYEFVTAHNSTQAVEQALKAHEWDAPYSVELVLEGHHIDQQQKEILHDC